MLDIPRSLRQGSCLTKYFFILGLIEKRQEGQRCYNIRGWLAQQVGSPSIT